MDGVTVEYRRKDGSIAGAQARVIDFDTPANNDWLAVNQFIVAEGQHVRRPDMVLFVNGLAVVFKEVSAIDDAALEEGLRDGQWAAVYVMPGFSRAELARVRRICETRRVLPVAASVDDLEQGLAFGIGVDGNRPQLVVNLPASKACGSDFDLALLQLSKVLR